jgi:hypothetical protein
MAAGALSCNHSAFAVELAQCCTLVDSFKHACSHAAREL